MKKQLKWVVAALAATAMATPAFALTVDTKGFIEIRGQADKNMKDGSDRNDNDNDRTGVDQRLRLWTEAAADENVKGVFAIEVDNYWGDTSGGGARSDGKGTIEVKHLYLDFNLTKLNTNVKAGTQYFKIGGGFIAGDDASGVQTSTKLGDAATLKLAWAHLVEDIDSDVVVGPPASNGPDQAFGNISGDSDFYGAQVDIKAGPMTVSPIFAYTRYAKNMDLFFGGVDVNGKFGENTKLVLTLIKNWGDDNPTAGMDKIDGTAAYLGLFQAAGKADFAVEAAWIGDNGRNGGEFVDGSGPLNNGWGLHSPTEMMGGNRYDARIGVGQALGGNSALAPANLYYLNQAYLKVTGGFKTSDTTKLTAYVAHIQQADGSGAGVNGNGGLVYGQEVGAYYDITLAKGLSYGLMGAYLFNDDFGTNNGGNDDVWKLGNAITYKF